MTLYISVGTKTFEDCAVRVVFFVDEITLWRKYSLKQQVKASVCLRNSGNWRTCFYFLLCFCIRGLGNCVFVVVEKAVEFYQTFSWHSLPSLFPFKDLFCSAKRFRHGHSKAAWLVQAALMICWLSETRACLSEEAGLRNSAQGWPYWWSVSFSP